MDEIMSAGDLTGYVHIEGYTGGFDCAFCGAWVQWNQSHSCYPQNIFPMWQPTFQPTYNPVLSEIKELLEKILELLLRE